jgi:hypothetical protein
MKKLPPLVDGVNGKFLKVRALDDVDYDFLGYLLCCHLVIEHHLDEFLATQGTRLQWDRARLTFAHKTLLFPVSIFPHGADLIMAIKHLNSLRNKVAHNIKARPQELSFEPLKSFLRKVHEGRENVPDEPYAILEAFTSTVCAFLIGWIACDAYYTNWRQERQAQGITQRDDPPPAGLPVTS